MDRSCLKGRAGVVRSLITCLLCFFSSRRRHTRFDCDWSSDVCSSDLPLTRARHREDPELESCRELCVAQMGALGVELVLPLVFRDRLTGILGLSEKRSGAAYSTDDLRLLRTLANQSAVALENARAYADLQDANRHLGRALRRVEMLEAIRAHLAKLEP